MTFAVLFRQSAADFLHTLPEKSQRIITAKLAGLQTDPYPGSGGAKERLNTDGMEVSRLRIGRSFTALYLIHIDRNRIEITHLMTIEQAHKRYAGSDLPHTLGWGGIRSKCSNYGEQRPLTLSTGFSRGLSCTP